MPVRLYGNPEEFAGMMIRHLQDSLKLEVRATKDEPLLLDIAFDPAKKEERAQVSLHNIFLTYMRTGDLNAAVDYLNSIIRCSVDMRDKGEEMAGIDPAYIYPALRDKRYVEEAGRGSGMLAEESIPGLNVVFLEIKNSYSKIISKTLLERHPRLTEDRVKRLAYRNLRSAGWTPSKLTLQSPFRPSCFVEAFLDNSYPVECQFLQPQLASANLPSSFLIAFPNRKTVLLMRSEEDMHTEAVASRLAKKAKFTDTVKRSHRLMPHPVSDRIYWSHHGVFRQLQFHTKA